MRKLNALAIILLSFACQTTRQDPSTLSEFYEQSFDSELQNYPQQMSYLGIKKDYDRLDDLSEKSQEQAYQRLLKRQRAFDKYKASQLSSQDMLSYKLYKKTLESEIADYKYRHHNYPVNQMFGLQSHLPSFMINIHQVSTLSDAEAYISRLQGVGKQFEQLIEGLKLREKKV